MRGHYVLQTRLVAPLCVLVLAAPGRAGLRKQCRQQCSGVITGCVIDGGRPRICRHQIRARCRTMGLATCVSTTTTSTAASSTTTTAPRFTDLGDGRVRDPLTALEGEVKTTAFGSGGNATDLHDVDNSYTWAGCCGGACDGASNYCQPNAAAEAACEAQTAPERWGSAGCAQCAVGRCEVDPLGDGAITTVWDWVSQLNAALFAGQGDWRLPTMAGCCGQETGDPAELESIAEPALGSPTADPSLGPTAPSLYWSASTLAATPGQAWDVFFSDGGSCHNPKEFDLHVRAVRSRRTSAF